MIYYFQFDDIIAMAAFRLSIQIIISLCVSNYSLYPSCVFFQKICWSIVYIFFLSDSQIIENVHSILATAASKLNLELYEHLTTLIKKKWEISEGRVREKLLRLIGLIGREAKSSKSIEATLAVLWEVVSQLCFNFWNYPSLFLYVWISETIFVYSRIKKKIYKNLNRVILD